MAFPSTPILDTFPYSDGSMPSTWTFTLPGFATCTIFSNAVVTTSGTDGYANWNVATFFDTEVFVTITGTDFGYVASRINAPNTAGVDGYYCRGSDSLNSVDLYRVKDNVATSLDTGISMTTANPYQLGTRTRNVGNDIIIDMFINGARLSTFTDTNAVINHPTLAVPGYIGLGLVGAGNSLTKSLDNFGGGETAVTHPGSSGIGQAESARY